jgi:hypothetical protein
MCVQCRTGSDRYDTDVENLSFASSAHQHWAAATDRKRSDHCPVQSVIPSADSNGLGTRRRRFTMLILELKPGELLRLRTPSGEVIDVIVEDSSQHRVRFSITAPPTIHIDTEGKSETTSKRRVTKRRKKSTS